MRANIKYMLKNWIAWDKKSPVYFLIRVPALVFQPIVTAYIPKAMIDCIEKGVTTRQLILVVADEPTANMQRFGTRRQSIMCSLQQHNNAAPCKNKRTDEKAKNRHSHGCLFFLAKCGSGFVFKDPAIRSGLFCRHPRRCHRML